MGKKLLKRDSFEVILLFLPGLIFFALFTLYPILRLFQMSFFQYDVGGPANAAFIGLKNYIEVFSDKVSLLAITNTLIYGAITIPGQIILGLLIAVFINNLSRGRLLYRVIYYFPVITSWVIVSVLFRYIFQNEGYLNYILTNFNIVAEPVKWLDSRVSALLVLSIIGVWKGVGWSMTVFLAALTAVPAELYESAKVDGCGKVKQFFYITLPGIRSTMLFSVVMLTIGAFNTFTPVKLITDGKPLHKTEFILTWMYKNAFEYRNMGYAAALSFLVAIIISGIAVFQFKVFSEE